MATTTFHISFPGELAKHLAKDIKKGHYTPSEYFKMLYRWYKTEESIREAERCYEEEKKAGTLKELKGSIMDLVD